MGTNYYFFTKNKQLAREFFPSQRMPNDRWGEGAVLTDEPEFGYEIHLCKISAGWLPLMEVQPDAYTNFREMEAFYLAHKDDLIIRDEYDEEFTWDAFKNTLIVHSQRKPEPQKWVKRVLEVFGTKPSLYLEKCKPEEADLWIPFRHDEYDKTMKEAARRIGYSGYLCGYDSDRDVPYRDDTYPFDWNYGSFS